MAPGPGFTELANLAQMFENGLVFAWFNSLTLASDARSLLLAHALVVLLEEVVDPVDLCNGFVG